MTSASAVGLVAMFAVDMVDMYFLTLLGEQELAQLQGQLEQLPAGGSLLALIGAVFVVLLILEVTGVINIFNKV